jgi:hypothetical protein
MSFSVDQKIEVLKITVGLVIAIVGGLWTFTTFTQEQREAELKTLIELGDSIAGMNVTCISDYGPLSKLAADKEDFKKKKCYLYFENAYKKSIAAQILIKKPVFCGEQKWNKLWNNLVDKMSLAASSEYIYNDINTAWNSILIEKSLIN